MKLFEVSSVLFWDMLTEDKKTEYMLNKYASKLQNVSHDQNAKNLQPDEIIQKLTLADPTPNKQYIDTILNWYVNKQFRVEDVNRIKGHLELFNKVKPKLPVEQRNITSIKKLSELYRILAPFQEKPEAELASNKEIKKQNKLEGVEVIMNTPKFKVYNVLTEAAAKLYGKGTQWCTAGDKDNMFESYKKQGNIYIIIAGDRKFQLHMESNQFMDEQDTDLTETDGDIEYLSNIPEYTQFLNMMIKKYYMS